MSEGCIANVFSLPALWPPVCDVRLLERVQNGSGGIRVVCTSRGTLLLAIYGSNSVKYYESQPLKLIGGRWVVLAVIWNEKFGEIFLNGDKLLLHADGVGKMKEVQCGIGPERPLVRKLPDYTTRVLSNEEQLFIATLVDLQQKFEKGDHYSLLKASGLVRQLLLDGNPLLHQVNRLHHLKLKFQIIQYEDPPFSPETYIPSLSPSSGSDGTILQLDLSAFIKTECMKVMGRVITIHQLIDVYAHNMGGIHSGPPGERDSLEAELMSLRDTLRVINAPAIDGTMRDICEITLQGCIALANAVCGFQNDE